MKTVRIDRPWTPSAMEEKCLRHLDSSASWNLLRTEPHGTTEVLGWAPFRRIFLFNMILFGPVLALVFLGIEKFAGSGREELLEDLPYGIPGALVLAVGFSLYSMFLYRRSWNKRAQSLHLQGFGLDEDSTA